MKNVYMYKCATYNLGQKAVDKFTKLSKISFSVERFRAVLRVFIRNFKICLLGSRLGTPHQIRAFQEFLGNVLIF